MNVELSADFKKWAEGVADEAWKVRICQRDARHARELMRRLAYILGGDGPCISQEDCAAVISKFEGAQIAEALIRYEQSALKSIENGKKRET